MKMVETKFISDYQENNETKTNTQRKAKYIDDGEDAMTDDIAPGCFPKRLKHFCVHLEFIIL
jgi:adenylate kinase family enzyme